MRSKLAILSLVTTFLTPAMANAAEWTVVLILTAGNLTTCTQSAYDKYTVVEENGTLTLNSLNKRVRNMTVPLKPDGSAVGDFQMQLGGTQWEPVRVKVPAGSGRRQFQYLNLKNVCSFRADPI
jgi:hypothetical protein